MEKMDHSMAEQITKINNYNEMGQVTPKQLRMLLFRKSFVDKPQLVDST